MIVQSLDGYTSPEKSYLVTDYPYGRDRCHIRFWVEYGGQRKGYRVCAQTRHPRTERWNNPKKSTYSTLAENLYLDEKGHVQSCAINEFSSAHECGVFIAYFPKNPAHSQVVTYCRLKAAMYQKCVDKGVDVFNRPLGERERDRYVKDAEEWAKAVNGITLPEEECHV